MRNANNDNDFANAFTVTEHVAPLVSTNEKINQNYINA